LIDSTQTYQTKAIFLIQYERIQRLFKEGFWIFFGQLMVVIGSLFGLKMLTTIMDPSVYGELVLAITFATIINQIILGPLSNGVVRFYASAKELSDIYGYMRAVLKLVFFASLLISAVVFVSIIGLCVAKQYDYIHVIIMAFIFSILNGNNSILSGIQNAARQRAIVAVCQGIESWIKYLAAAGLMLWFGATSVVALAGFASASIIVIGLQFALLGKTACTNLVKSSSDNLWAKKILDYSWPFATWGIFSWAQLSSDRWALGLFGTKQDVGRYAVLFQLGYYPMSMITGMILQLMAPIFYQRIGDATNKIRNASVNKLGYQLSALALIITGIAFLGGFFYHKQVFILFVDEKYSIVSCFLPWMLLSGGIFAAGQIISLNLMSQLKTYSLIAVKIVTAILGIVFNFVGAYFLGTKGIVVALILFSVVYFIWITFLSATNIEKSI
jgi:O-antigen/teichoic acid export membrane protein